MMPSRLPLTTEAHQTFEWVTSHKHPRKHVALTLALCLRILFAGSIPVDKSVFLFGL